MGDGTLQYSNIPKPTVTGEMNGKSIIKITSGLFHSCVIASDFQAYCWGFNKLKIFFEINFLEFKNFLKK
jgi:alpha-tubulin suppressor-like RCC1 family protein